MKEIESARDIGTMVRFHRKKARMTQAELAKFSEVGKTVVFDVENGKATVRLSTLLRILHALNIRMEFSGPLMHVYQKVKHEKS
jgi:HTH-type transcriptional regulator / antitoxin HipB